MVACFQSYVFVQKLAKWERNWMVFTCQTPVIFFIRKNILTWEASYWPIVMHYMFYKQLIIVLSTKGKKHTLLFPLDKPDIVFYTTMLTSQEGAGGLNFNFFI